MKITTSLLALMLFGCFCVGMQARAQTKANDIPISKLPNEVKEVLEQYLKILTSSTDLDECSEKFLKVAGGTLVNDDAQSLRSTVKEFGLKKDFNNIKHYAQPTAITRVNVSTSNGTGYGESAIKGKIYKIWIDKKSKNLSMPAPISILMPEAHTFIKTPKVINIGSL